MDLLDLLLRDEHADARQELRTAFSRSESDLIVQEVTFNAYEVLLDREVGGACVFDVLDGYAEPTIVTLDELRRRPSRPGAHPRRLRRGPQVGVTDRSAAYAL